MKQEAKTALGGDFLHKYSSCEKKKHAKETVVKLCLRTGHQTYHLVDSEAVIELQGRNVVGLLKIMNHQEFSVVETPCALEELLETFLGRRKTNKKRSGISFGL